MQKKTKKYFFIGGMLFVLFAVFTIMVMQLDVQPIGPEQSRVGFAALNKSVFEFLGESLVWYHVTEWTGVIAVLIALGFSVLGLVQLIKIRSIKKVDKNLKMLGIFYMVVIICYFFFEIFTVNYRPVILNGGLEASYPSSHSMAILCIMSSAAMQFQIRIKKKEFRKFLVAASGVIIAVTMIGRLLSGVHWATDIFAGTLLGSSLSILYYAALKQVE